MPDPLPPQDEILRQSEEQFRLLAENSLLGVWIHEDYVMRYANKRFAAMLGYEAGEIIGSDLWRYVHPDEEEKFRGRAMERSLEQEPSEHYEVLMMRKDGTVFPVDVFSGEVTFQGRPARMGHMVDITGRKRAEEALRESEAKYRTFFENSGDAMLMIRDYTFVDCNAATVAMLRHDSKEDLLDTHPSELSPEFQPDGRESYGKAIEMMDIALTQGTHRFEWDHMRKDGEVFPVEVSLTAIPLDGERVLHTVWRDITDRKQADEKRETLEGQLRQSQKMEAVGLLAGGVAHDFNNLLQVIGGYAEMMLEDAKTGSSAHENLEVVMEATARATTLVKQLLAFSRQQVLDMKDVNLNDVIADLIKMIRRVIGEHITLDVLPGHELGIIRADSGQIEQILMNLCVNARDAMPTGGKIAIETENVRMDEAYCETHSWATPGRYALLSVTDTGCGMDEDTLRKVFVPFFTTKDIGKGSGLGLSTVYGLVEQHKGLVHVYSEIGKGTTFKIYLPVVERAAVTVGHKIEGSAPGGAETILLAEDDAMVRRLSQSILERAGYTVLPAIDGREAVRVFEEHAGQIDLALLDVMMPNLGGRAVYDHIHKARPEIRVLFSSGYSMNAIHTDFVLDKGLTLIQKPFHRDDLLRRVREVLDR